MPAKAGIQRHRAGARGSRLPDPRVRGDDGRALCHALEGRRGGRLRLAKSPARSKNASPEVSSVSSQTNGRSGNRARERLAAADLADERALRRQMRRRLRDDAAHDVEPVHAAGMGHPRLGREFGRKFRERRRVDIRRVGQDQIVAAAPDAARTDRPAEARCGPRAHAPRHCGARLRARRRRDRPRRSARSERRARREWRASRRRCRGRAREATPRAPRSARCRRRTRSSRSSPMQAARHDDAFVDVERHALDIGAVAADRRRACGSSTRASIRSRAALRSCAQQPSRRERDRACRSAAAEPSRMRNAASSSACGRALAEGEAGRDESGRPRSAASRAG